MATEEKTFDALLGEAPLYRKSDTVTLTGALARSPEEGKFALMQADGSAVTLDSSAVKSHTVIGSSFGQQIVQVELDAEKVPKETVEQTLAFNPQFNTVPQSAGAQGDVNHRLPPVHQETITAPLQDNVFTRPMLDHPATNPVADGWLKPPYSDVTTGIADHHTGVLNDAINTGIADHHTGLFGDVPTLPGGPGYPSPEAGSLPFSLATGHQAPAEAMARMEALAYASPLALGRTDPNDGGDKTPRSDGTYPVFPAVYRNGRQLYHMDS